MSDFAWIPVHQAPEKWEGENVLWRSGPDQSPKIRTLPKGFSRVRAHTGAIEVAGPVGDVFNNLATIATLTAALVEARGALEGQINELQNALDFARMVINAVDGDRLWKEANVAAKDLVAALDRARTAIATINAALGRTEG